MTREKLRDGFFKVRPAGRHLATIGRDLIKDKYAAIVELVKNSYDADSLFCKVSLKPFKNQVDRNGEIVEEVGIKIEVVDSGHGMSFDTVVTKWMVPSTEDKLIRKKSPQGRVLQGRKGVGRYAASMLGDDLVLQTVTKEGDLTALYLIWEDFEKAQYLDDVNVLIENYRSTQESGTHLTILGGEDYLNEWTQKQIQNLKFELKKLIPPATAVSKDDSSEKYLNNDFKILLELGDFPFPSYSNYIETIEPYPLFELYDYRISGTVSPKGFANLTFQNRRATGAPVELLKEFKITLNADTERKSDEAYCGELNIDFRVFDRDSASIDGLIERGLKDPATNEYVGRREARLILDRYNGIGVFRNGFRLRPLGDAGYDWLELDKKRVQNPSLRIGVDQVIGFIHIEAEESSGLEEKSARDGLKENKYFFGLKEICLQILTKLEERRFAYRLHVGLGRGMKDKGQKLSALLDFASFRNSINKELDNIKADGESRERINKAIMEKEQETGKLANELKSIIALYQGQATLGKIVNVILHEGRKPLGYFKNQIPLLVLWSSELESEFNPELLSKIVNRLEGVNEQSEMLIKLFNKLDPLSSKKRDIKRDFSIIKVIEDIRNVFSSQLDANGIEYVVDCPKVMMCYGWKEDLYIVITNLVDNSLYWLQSVSDRPKKIRISVFEEDDLIKLEYRDNGPGIEKHLIESEVIFEPEFSNKPSGGTGLGLAIAGEAIARNDGTIKAIYSETGAFFKIEISNLKN